MLIRSQDKKTIIPIEHGYIALSNYNNRSQIIFSVINENDAYLALGTYSTDENALKVLDMIQDIYSDNGRPIEWHNAHKIFQMPKDEELELYEVTETEKELADALNTVENYKRMLFGN